MRFRTIRIMQWLGLGLILCAAGCAVGPDYQPPTVDMPDQWHQQLTEGFAVDESMPEQWWQLLNDPILDGLIEQVRANNPDLESAYQSLMQARYARDYATGDYYPTVDGVGSATRSRLSDNSYMGGGNFETYSLGFDAVWELNLFGEKSRQAESAQATLEAQIENYRDVLVTLTAETARNYVELRTIQARIQYTLQNIESQQGMLELAQVRFDSELAPRLDVEQARLNLADTRSQIPTLRSAERATVNRLCVLTGRMPGELGEQLSEIRPIPVPPAEMHLVIPAELLRQRPDIRRTERQLAAQSARIGAATAQLYPQFSLAGNLGFESVDFTNLTDSSSRVYGVGPSFRWNLFSGNRVRNQIKIEESKTAQLYQQYEMTVLSAVEEAENAITDYIQQSQRRQTLQESVEAAKRSVELITTQYKNGLTDFQSVLVLQRSQFQQEDKLAQSEGQVVQDMIRIYKAMGGWGDDVPADAEANTPAAPADEIVDEID